MYLPANGNTEIEIRLLVSLNTKSKEVCRMCLDYLSMHEDVKCYSIAMSRTDKKGNNLRKIIVEKSYLSIFSGFGRNYSYSPS